MRRGLRTVGCFPLTLPYCFQEKMKRGVTVDERCQEDRVKLIHSALELKKRFFNFLSHYSQRSTLIQLQENKQPLALLATHKNLLFV